MKTSPSPISLSLSHPLSLSYLLLLPTTTTRLFKYRSPPTTITLTEPCSIRLLQPLLLHLRLLFWSRSSVVVVVVVVVVAKVVVVEKLVLLRYTTIATHGKDVGKGGMMVDYSFSPRHPGITTTAVTCESVCSKLVIVGEVRISLSLSVCFILTQL